MHLLLRQVCFLAFQTSGIYPIPLAFKASFVSTAPLVVHLTSAGSRIWTGSLTRINSSYLSKHSIFTTTISWLSPAPIESCWSSPKCNPPNHPTIACLHRSDVVENLFGSGPRSRPPQPPLGPSPGRRHTCCRPGPPDNPQFRPYLVARTPHHGRGTLQRVP